MSRIVIFNFILFWFSIVSCWGQTKFEREYRIKEQKVPNTAVSFIQTSFGQQKVKWYKEESQDGITIEAKTNYKKNWYSIEFDTNGNVLDVEKKVCFEVLDASIKNNIESTLNSLFIKYKIKKTQVQWKARENALTELIQDGKTQQDYDLHYEIVLRAKKEKVYKSYEVLLDTDGKLIKNLEIITRNSDNLQF